LEVAVIVVKSKKEVSFEPKREKVEAFTWTCPVCGYKIVSLYERMTKINAKRHYEKHLEGD